MTFESGVRLGIGHRPIKRLALRIIRTRQSPAAGDAPLCRYVAPRIAARLAGNGGVLEFPNLFSVASVGRRFEAAPAPPAGPPRAAPPPPPTPPPPLRAHPP